MPALLRFLAGRQLAYVDPPEGEESDDEDEGIVGCEAELGAGCEHVGFNGRWNKRADTCYCWWVGGTLKVCPSTRSTLKIPTDHTDRAQILGHEDLLDKGPSRAFLLDKTQHMVGGFGKHPGVKPDAYHSYLGLAALATLGDEELGGFDAALCASEGVVGRIERGRARLVGK